MVFCFNIIDYLILSISVYFFIIFIASVKKTKKKKNIILWWSFVVEFLFIKCLCYFMHSCFLQFKIISHLIHTKLQKVTCLTYLIFLKLNVLMLVLLCQSQNLFKCNDCGREFLQRCDLKRHLLIHAKQEPHRCEKCGKGWCWKYLMQFTKVMFPFIINNWFCKFKSSDFYCISPPSEYVDLTLSFQNKYKIFISLFLSLCVRFSCSYMSEYILENMLKCIHSWSRLYST